MSKNIGIFREKEKSLEKLVFRCFLTVKSLSFFPPSVAARAESETKRNEGSR